MREKCHALRAIFLLEITEALGEKVECLLPSRTLEFAFAALPDADHRVFQPVVVVEQLCPGIAARAQAALGERMVRVPGDTNYLAISDFRYCATAPEAHLAIGGDTFYSFRTSPA
jgi:hypothetical protein